MPHTGVSYALAATSEWTPIRDREEADLRPYLEYPMAWLLGFETVVS